MTGEITTEPPAVSTAGGRHRVPLHREPILPLLLVVTGLSLVAAMDWLDTRNQDAQPWSRAMFVVGAPLPAGTAEDGAVAVAFRDVPESNYPPSPLAEALKEAPMGDELIHRLGLNRSERIIAFPGPRDEFAPLLESGRLPEPGQPEVLAGAFASLDSFDLDGETYRAVGRFKRGVSIGFSYVLPECGVESFAAAPDAIRAWAFPNGLDDDALAKLDESALVAGAVRVSNGLFAGILAGLLLTALGAAIAQWHLFRWLDTRLQRGLFHPVLAEYRARPGLVVAVHVYLYGVFFVFTIVAASYPVIQAQTVGLASDMFTQGNLSYIGDAYASGDIFYAAATTFYHNFFIATVLLTVLPSIFMPFAGVLKNTLSFAAVGFVLSPIWSGLAERLTYHAVTIVLELEAYILATFIVCALPINMFVTHGPLAGCVRGLKVLASGTILAGVILLIAAFYEAATLIWLTQ